MKPRVVAVGGGHGTAVTLRAARAYAGSITAVVSVADDGGSTGRLREQFDVVALGDIRKCLVALAGHEVLSRAFEHRFGAPDEGSSGTVHHADALAGHALGNLVLAGLIETTGDLLGGVDAAGGLLQAEGRVLPATTEKVSLKAEYEGGELEGQAAIAATGRIRRVSLVPGGSRPPDDVGRALAEADQIVIGPGSLYTSVLAAVAVPGIADAISVSTAQKVYVANLDEQPPETSGYDVEAHVTALRRHGVNVDAVIWDSGAGLARGALSTPTLDVALRGSNGRVHDPARLAGALLELLGRREEE